MRNGLRSLADGDAAASPQHGGKGLRIAIWTLNAAAIYRLIYIVFCHSNAGVSVLAFLALYHGSFAIGIAWVIIVVGHLIQRWKGRPRLRARSLLVAPALLVLTPVIYSMLPAPPENPLFRARFALSRPALTAKAKEALKTGTIANDQYIGLFHVEFASVYDGQVRFLTTGCGILYSCGLVYAPSGTLTKGVEDQLTHLDGPWWRVIEGF